MKHKKIEYKLHDIIKKIDDTEIELDILYEDFNELSCDCPHLIDDECRHKTVPYYLHANCYIEDCPLAEIKDKKIKPKKVKEDISSQMDVKFNKIKSNCFYIDSDIDKRVRQCFHPKQPTNISVVCRKENCPIMKEKEKEMDKKYVRLKVVMTKEYLIPVDDNYPTNPHTYINGWSLERVIEDWFKRHSLGSHHASREANSIGGSEKFIKAIEMETI